MKDDDYEKLAAEIWRGNTQTIANIQEMDVGDLRQIEKVFRDKYKVDIALNISPAEIHFTLGKLRATKSRNTIDDNLDRALREANAEDS